MSNPRSARRGLLLALAAIPLALSAGAAQKLPAVEVFKTPACGCCDDWIKHLQANGFQVTPINVPDLAPVRARLGMPARYGSCHTARVGGYLVEGHVPAREVRRLLRERPASEQGGDEPAEDRPTTGLGHDSSTPSGSWLSPPWHAGARRRGIRSAPGAEASGCK